MSRLGKILIGFLATSTAPCVFAQETRLVTPQDPPAYRQVDPNGIDLASGQYTKAQQSISIGDPKLGGMVYSMNFIGWVNGPSQLPDPNSSGTSPPSPRTATSFPMNDNLQSYLQLGGPTPGGINVGPGGGPGSPPYMCKAIVGQSTAVFSSFQTVNCLYGNALITPTYATMANLAQTGGTMPTITLRDGSVATFSGGKKTVCPIGGGVWQCSSTELTGWVWLTKIVKPTGEILTYHYNPSVDTPGVVMPKLVAVTSSLGVAVKYNYSGTGGSASVPWNKGGGSIYKVVAFNSAAEYCDVAGLGCVFTNSWPSMSFSQAGDASGDHVSVTDSLGNSTLYTTVYEAGYSAIDFLSASVRSAMGKTDSIVFDTAYDFKNINNCWKVITVNLFPQGSVVYKVKMTNFCESQRVISLSDGQQSWSYSYSFPGFSDAGGIAAITDVSSTNFPTVTTRTNPDGSSVSAKSEWSSGQLVSFIDEIGRTTTVGVNGPPYQIIAGQINSIQHPVGDGETYTYDDRGNLLTTTVLSVPDAAGNRSSLTTTYTYAASCTNMVTCNLPLTKVDPKNGQTDYTYDSVHGGILTETMPAGADGVRPQKRYSYSQLSAKSLNSSGQLVANPPVWRLTRISECVTATAANPASCVGTTAERVETLAYNHNNLWLTSRTVALGNGTNSLTTSFTYDAVGNVISVTDPKGNTSYTTYDGLRRKVFEIGALPGDGNPRPMTRHLYDADGNEVRTEVGTGLQTNGSDFTMLRHKEMTFDPTTGLLTKVLEVVP